MACSMRWQGGECHRPCMDVVDVGVLRLVRLWNSARLFTLVALTVFANIDITVQSQA